MMHLSDNDGSEGRHPTIFNDLSKLAKATGDWTQHTLNRVRPPRQLEC